MKNEKKEFELRWYQKKCDIRTKKSKYKGSDTDIRKKIRKPEDLKYDAVIGIKSNPENFFFNPKTQKIVREGD